MALLTSPTVKWGSLVCGWSARALATTTGALAGPSEGGWFRCSVSAAVAFASLREDVKTNSTAGRKLGATVRKHKDHTTERKLTKASTKAMVNDLRASKGQNAGLGKREGRCPSRGREIFSPGNSRAPQV